MLTRVLSLLALLTLACTLPAPTQPMSTAISEATSGTSDRWIPPLPTKTTDCHTHDGLPDSACTPGATDPRVTQANIAATICQPGYSASVRPPVSVTEHIKRNEMLVYGLAGQPLSDVELDHLVSIELGGAPADTANLWPESWTGDHNAHEKDAAENRLHAQVCRGTLLLIDAQRMIATDWQTATP